MPWLPSGAQRQEIVFLLLAIEAKKERQMASNKGLEG